SEEDIANVLKNANVASTAESSTEVTDTSDSQSEDVEENHTAYEDESATSLEESSVEGSDYSDDNEVDFTDVLTEEGLKYASEAGEEAADALKDEYSG